MDISFDMESTLPDEDRNADGDFKNMKVKNINDLTFKFPHSKNICHPDPKFGKHRRNIRYNVPLV